MNVGVLTIGQSPRSEVTGELRQELGPAMVLVELGLLDGLPRAAIEALSPCSADPVLVTRLQDGREVRLAKRHVVERIPACLARLERQGVDIHVLWCTEEFPDIESKKPVIKPAAVIRSLVNAILPQGQLGILVPEASQMPAVERQWDASNLELCIEALSPYGSSEPDVIDAATRLKAAGVDLILLDCMGYGRSIKAICHRVTSRPVLLPLTLVGKLLKECL